MTYFDIKDVVFVNKIANCRKSAKEKVCACRGRRLDFWKISAGLPRKIQRSPNITEARQGFHICSKAAFLRATQPREGLHNDCRRKEPSKHLRFTVIPSASSRVRHARHLSNPTSGASRSVGLANAGCVSACGTHATKNAPPFLLFVSLRAETANRNR